MPHGPKTRLFMAVSVAAILLALAPAAAAKTYVPNRLGDHALNGGGCTQQDCTLREAIRAANTRAGADRIVLASGQVYQLAVTGGNEDAAATGDLDVTETLTIARTGSQRATIDANDLDRVLDVNSGTATLNGVVLRDGFAFDGGLNGGGVRVEASGRAILNGSVVSGCQAQNQGGGVSNVGGFVRLSRSVVRNNKTIDLGGGGIFTVGKVEVVESAVDSNHSAFGGGGIELGGAGSNASVRNSTVSRNTAGHPGGQGDGGGIRNFRGQLRMRSSTVANNRATGHGGGIIYDATIPASPAPVIVLNNVTVARNVADSDNATPQGDGGGIAEFNDFGGQFKVGNTLIALNTVGTSGGFHPNCFTNNGVTSLGHNLLGTSDPFCSGFTAAGDIVRAQPKLAALGSYGGPTETIRLNAGSPAIGAADPLTAENRDQRGRGRDAAPDIGAFERLP